MVASAGSAVGLSKECGPAMTAGDNAPQEVVFPSVARAGACEGAEVYLVSADVFSMGDM